MVALPILKTGYCWRVGNGSSIRVHWDRWIPNYLTNKVLYPANEETKGLLVSDLIDLELHWWRREFIMSKFHTEDAEAICIIPLNCRYVLDTLIWMYNKDGMFSVKSAYKVAMQIQRGEDWIENSSGYAGKQVWTAMWKVRISNEIKVFGWRACHEILPTRMNLAKR